MCAVTSRLAPRPANSGDHHEQDRERGAAGALCRGGRRGLHSQVGRTRSASRGGRQDPPRPRAQDGALDGLLHGARDRRREGDARKGVDLSEGGDPHRGAPSLQRRGHLFPPVPASGRSPGDPCERVRRGGRAEAGGVFVLTVRFTEMLESDRRRLNQASRPRLRRPLIEEDAGQSREPRSPPQRAGRGGRGP